MDLTDAVIKAKLACIEHQHRGLFGYARTYIDALRDNRNLGPMLRCSSAECDRTQLCYVAANLTAWRGPEAREAKAVIKAFLNAKIVGASPLRLEEVERVR